MPTPSPRLRTLDVTYDDLYGGSPNYDLYDSQGFVDFVMPSDFDSSDSSNPFVITVRAGAYATDPTNPPQTFEVDISYEIWTSNGGSYINAPLAPGNFSLAVGTVNQAYHGIGGGAPNITNVLGPITETANLSFPAVITPYNANTVVDGSGISGIYAGQGFLNRPSPPLLPPWQWTGPVGWDPFLGWLGDATTEEPITAGQSITFAFNIFIDNTSASVPTAGVYGTIELIECTYKGITYPIDLTQFRVGFGVGGPYTRYDHSQGGGPPIITTQVANPRRIVDYTPTPPNYPNQQVYEDFYLESYSPAVSQRINAWTFILDGHRFYVLSLGTEGDWAYDTTTQEWCQLTTQNFPGINFTHGVMWGIRVMGGDISYPILYEMDPAQPLDGGTTSVAHIVTGGVPTRTRSIIGVANFTVTASVADDSEMGNISLAFSDDNGVTWSPEFDEPLTDTSSQKLIWNALGSFSAPGRIFRITDYSGPVRLDGADVVLTIGSGADSGQQSDGQRAQ